MRTASNTGLCIRVPASTSNLGAAFDAVGLALQLFLTVGVRKLEQGPSRIEVFGEDAHLIPADGSNYLWRCMVEIAAKEQRSLPFFSLEIGNEIPISKGLGSSSCALLAAAAAVDFLCGMNWGKEKLLEIGMAREGHPDNLAPSLYGGLVASICGNRVVCSRSEFPPDWTVIAVTPDLEVSTEKARSLLPVEIPYKHAIHNIQRTAFLMAQLVQGRREGLREAMSDMLHQPYRGKLIPGLDDILAMEQCEGLLGIALSGAGSSVIAFADSHEYEIGEAIRRIFQSHGLSSRSRLLKASPLGLTRDYL